MQTLRHLLTAFSIAIGLWAAASVGGVLFDPSRLSFWSASLMWSLLASLLVAPALVVMTDDTISNGEGATPLRKEASATRSSAPTPPVDEQPSFVDDAQAAYPMVPHEPDSSEAEAKKGSRQAPRRAS